MKKTIVTILVLLTAAQVSFAQYFQKLHDIDSSYDWGKNLFVNPDGSYFVSGPTENQATPKAALFNVHISPDGNTVSSLHTIRFDSANIYAGDLGGTMIQTPSGYLSPVTLQWHNYVTGYLYSAGGLVKYDATGNTVFIKTYNDTSHYFVNMYTCALMPDGGYIVGGIQTLNTAFYYPGYIIRTDSLGDTLWTHTYQKYDTEVVQINSIVPLDNGRILVGASTERLEYGGPPHYFGFYDQDPWYMVLDSMGNILRDTVYTLGFHGGGYIYKDMNGGYITMGSLDSLIDGDPTNGGSFFCYIAHLDTNFRVTWLTYFTPSLATGHRDNALVRQLRDSSYVILGDKQTGLNPNNSGWVAKVSRTGAVVWNHFYESDSIQASYLRDVAERPDGSLVLIGCGINDSLPAWHTVQDIWLVSVDSNGCEVAGCMGSLAAPASGSASLTMTVSIWPNPTSGEFSVKVSEAGELTIYNMQGQVVATYPVREGNNELSLPRGLANGLYMGRFRGSDGSSELIRMVYEK